MKDKEIDKLFKEFWKPLVSKSDGTLDVELVKKELFDFYTLMGHLTKMYDHISGGIISIVNTHPEAVIQIYEERLEERYEEGFEEGIQVATNNVPKGRLI